MTRIIHLSDLHFGTEIPGITDIIIKDIKSLSPDIIIVSGDLTQRATSLQFENAKQFLKKFENIPVLCVPGNHDISLYNLIERFLYPFNKYKKWISKSLCISHKQDNLAILGINSVTPYQRMGGFVTDEQLSLVKTFFHTIPDSTIKIIMMHHNLIKADRHRIINDAEKIIQVFASCKVNLVLAGHIHFAAIELLKRSHFPYNMYIITAGTAISRRTIQANSYNIIDIDEHAFTLTVRMFDGKTFSTNNESVYSF